MKGFQQGHTVSNDTRQRISKANNGNFYAVCDYCNKTYHTKKSHYERRLRHFCTTECYSKYRTEILPKEEQNAFGTGHSTEERERRRKARETLNHYLRDKHIERKPCELCGGENAEAHHDDYSNPLDVRWLCFKCHRKWHKEHDNHELIGGEQT